MAHRTEEKVQEGNPTGSIKNFREVSICLFSLSLFLGQVVCFGNPPTFLAQNHARKEN